MLSMEEGSQISAYVEQTIVSWNTQNLMELADGRFFLFILETLQNFKLLNPIPHFTDELSLAAKVTVIKNLTKSLIKYHQTQLLRDVSELDINYVQLCMGNKKQLFRLITILFSAICSQENSRENVYTMIQKLSEDQSEVLKIMIENSLNIGQECGSCSSRSWRLSQQKKVFAKMELLENKIQELEIINRSLEEGLRIQKEFEENTMQENKKLKEEVKKLLIINDQLTDSHEKALNELKIANIEETATKKKFQLSKKKMEDKITKLEHEIEKLNLESQQSKNCKEKLLHITEINNQIKQQNQNLRQNITKLENEKAQLKKSLKVQNEEFISLKQHCSDLQIKIEQLSLSLAHSSNLGEKNNLSYKTSYFGNEESSDSNRYRVKENLDWLNNFHNYSIHETEKNLSWKKDKQFNNDNFEIRTISEKSFEDSSCLEQMKENQSIFMNSSEIFKVKQSYSQSKPKNQQKNHIQSITFESFSEMEKRYKEEIHLLTCIIMDLQTQLEEAQKANPIVIMDNNSMTVSRMNKFAQKVKEMFHNTEQNGKKDTNQLDKKKLSLRNENRNIK